MPEKFKPVSETEKADEAFMREALKEARKALGKEEVPVGAVIVCKGKIIARAHNLSEQLRDATAHAEMQAFTSAADYIGGKYLKECTLYVTLEPCVMCAGASAWTQIERIVFGASDPKRGYHRLGSDTLHPTTRIQGGVLEEECSTLLTDFFLNKR